MLTILDANDCKDETWGFGTRKRSGCINVRKKRKEKKIRELEVISNSISKSQSTVSLLTPFLVDSKNCRPKRLSITSQEIRCQRCNSSETKIYSNGNLIWTRDKDINGDWTNGYLCYNCAYENKKICCKCNKNLENNIKLKYYRIDGLWYGEFLCNKCKR